MEDVKWLLRRCGLPIFFVQKPWAGDRAFVYALSADENRAYSGLLFPLYCLFVKKKNG